MNDLELQTPDETWPESAISAYQTLVSVVQKQNETIQALQERLNLNSKNSNKSPSSDRKDKKSSKKRKRKTSSKSRGGQPGHKGTTRDLQEPTEVKESVPPSEACACGEGEWVPRGKIERFQVTELPEIRPDVIEYQRQSYDCSCCGASRYTGGPDYKSESRFGPHLQNYIIYLSIQIQLNIKHIKTNLKSCFGISISLGAVSDVIKRGGHLSRSWVDQLKQWFKTDPSPKHVDETGWFIFGERAYLLGNLNPARGMHDNSAGPMCSALLSSSLNLMGGQRL
jgi:hypothetical protein